MDNLQPAIAQMMNEIYRASKYLYVDPSAYQEYNWLREQQQSIPFEYLQSIHQNVIQRAQEQREINGQIISRNFNQLYPLAQLILDGDDSLEELENKVENFIPTNYSMRNVVYSNQLNNEVEQIARQVYPIDYGSNGDCAICLESLSNQRRIKYVPCNHVLHQSCAEAWDQTGLFCPLCKKEIEGWIPW